ncbi:hypothetical protein L596_007671 [Steinernema carpocapsae]|uniref:G-protein coupled receptors family 1 profile domain-containing protein n=1 Tax=Steinernema carpocapsae TaxID=34508 RepID=A0A4U5PA28_STECR|nr:hypothetical protein L596_007671 [Steinernema carpocapsae]
MRSVCLSKSTVSGIGTGTRGISAMVFDAFNVTVFSKTTCLILGTPTLLGIHLSQTTMVAIAMDRLFCIWAPILYRRTETIAFGFLRFSICCAYSTVGSSLPYFGLLFEPSTLPVCSSGAAAASWFSAYWILFSSVLTLVLYVVYISIYFIFSRRNSGSTDKNSVQRTITVTITAVLVSYFFLYCIPNLLILIAQFVGPTPTIISATSLITSIGSGLNAAGNVFIYGWKHTELRQAMKRIPLLKHFIICKDQVITVTTATPMSHSRMYG